MGKNKKSSSNKAAHNVHSSSSEAATAGGDNATDSATLPDVDVDSTTGAGANAGSAGEAHPVELLQVDTGDMVKVKQVLDEGVAAALLEYLPEHVMWDNLKLFLMFIACSFAMTAQFAPLPFPDSRFILGFCGAAYFLISMLLQAIQSLIDQDAILWTRPMDENWWRGTNNCLNSNGDPQVRKFTNVDLKQYGLFVRSSFPRYSEFFTITIQFYIKKKDKDNRDSTQDSPPSAVSKTWSVGQFFDKEGYFDEVGLGMEVDTLFDKFDRQQYDDPVVAVSTTTTATTGSSKKAKPKKD
jgi:signal peptidase complex subunit 2